MSQVQFTTLVLSLVLLGIPKFHCLEHPVSFEALSSLLNSKNEMVKAMVSMKQNGYQYGRVQTYLQALHGVKQNVRRLFAKDFADFGLFKDRQVLSKLESSISSNSLPDALYNSFTLNKENTPIKEFWAKMDAKIKSSLASNSKNVSILTWSGLCPNRLHLRKLSTALVCKNSLLCAENGKPYSTIKEWRNEAVIPHNDKTVYVPVDNHEEYMPGFGLAGQRQRQRHRIYYKKVPVYGHEDNLKIGCNGGSATCNVEKALPLMTAIFSYELEYMIMRNLCPKSCPDVNNCIFANSKQVLDEVAILTAYATNIPDFFDTIWKTFHSDFFRQKGFSDIEKAMTVVEDASKYFEVTELACTRLQFKRACPYADIYNTYLLIKRFVQRKAKARLVKDLRLYAKVKHAKMLEILKNEMNSIRVLSSIKALGENMKSYASGISKYFQGAASFEKEIAETDVATIKANLENYEKQVSVVQSELQQKLKKATQLMMAVVSTNLAQKVGELGALIATNSNPLKVIFTSPDVTAIMEKAGEIADATSQVVKGTTLLISLGDLTKDSVKLFNGFSQNKQQLSSLESVVNNIKNNNAQDIGKDSKRFLEEYGNYSPKVIRPDIEKNNALWSAFKEAICGLLEGDVGIGGAIPKSVAGGELLCERLEGVMAQYFALREDIFDFQTQLVDATARVVQGYIKQRLAKNIKGGNDLFYPSELTVASFLMQEKLQSVATAYCDFLEYKNQGQPVSACKTENGIFNGEKIYALIAYKDKPRYTELTRSVFIPTRASFPGDTGYIDLAGLATEEGVVFKMPANRTWLQHYHWMLAGQDTVPFLEDLEIFFPPSEKGLAKKQLTTTQVLTSSIAGSSFFTKNPDLRVNYILPSGYNKYLTVYDDGYHSCSPLHEMQDPYSLCGNLPKICDRTTNIASDILPTVISTWKVRLLIHQGEKKLKWDAPAPATNFLVRGVAKMRIPARSGRKRGFKEYLSARTSSVCCDGNTYIKSPHSRRCEPCPKGSTSKYRGLYCEIEK